jgi:hypothetical protein
LNGESGESRWKSLRRLLKIYGAELLVILENGIGNRRAILEQLFEYMRNFPTMDPEIQLSILAKLESTSQELHRASMALDEYIRINFPIAEDDLERR